LGIRSCIGDDAAARRFIVLQLQRRGWPIVAQARAVMPQPGADLCRGAQKEAAFVGIVPDALVPRRDPRAAEFHHVGGIREGPREGAAAGAVSRFENNRLVPRVLQHGSRGRTGEAGTDDQYI
jgi:hypothetical protein